MKRILSLLGSMTVSVMILLLMTAVSCSDESASPDGAVGLLSISIIEKTEKNLLLTPTAPSAEEVRWTYTLKKSNGTNGIGQVKEETPVAGSTLTASVSIGSWTAEVWGYRDADCRELVYHGSGSGDVSRSGGTISITATTITDVGQAHALNKNDVPKATADLLLMPVDVEGDINGTIRHDLEWIVGGETVATWLWQNDAWTHEGNAVSAAGQTVNVNPGNASVVAIVRNAGGDIVAAEGWETQEFAINCTYRIDGIISADTVVINSFFEIDPSEEMPADDAIVIGYRESSKGITASEKTTDLSQAITFPYVTKYLDSDKEFFTPSDLGLEKLYVTTVYELVTSEAENAWFGKKAYLGDHIPSNWDVKLTEVRYVSGTTDIQSRSLYYCKSVQRVWIPDSVTSIGYQAFTNCSSLTGLAIPAGVTEINNYAFSYCGSLTDITIPDGITSIGDYAFERCRSLSDIKIPDSVKTIGGRAFSYCDSLTNITIPNGVTSIGGYAFEYCANLATVTIGHGVSSIGSGIFNNCNSLTEIVVSEKNSAYTSVDGVLFTKGKDTIIKCPAAKLGNYYVPDTVSTIDFFAFGNCSGLTNITIPDSVTKIESHAFYNFSSLTDITIPNGVTSIGNYTFYKCYNLINITIPDSVTSIGTSTFELCTSLTDITIPDGVEEIKNYAFYDCTNLTTVTIGKNVITIGEKVFFNCSNLTELRIDRTKGSLNLSKASVPSTCTVLWRGEF